MIKSSNEKQGGNLIDYKITNLFNDTISSCNLNDIGYKGNIFTWANNQLDNNFRLDRFLASNKWIDSYKKFLINILFLKILTTHRFFLVSVIEIISGSSTSSKKEGQNLKKNWSTDEESRNIVKLTWNNSEGNQISKLKQTSQKLSDWGQQKFGNLVRKSKETCQNLDTNTALL